MRGRNSCGILAEKRRSRLFDRSDYPGLADLTNWSVSAFSGSGQQIMSMKKRRY
jgi:hypothetical protein